MTLPGTCDQRAVRKRTVLVFLRYAVAFVVLPQSVIFGGFYLSRVSDFALYVAWWSCAVYCMPVVALFGDRHFSLHALPGASDLAGHSILIAFYTGLALTASIAHACVATCRGSAELGAPPNGGPATPVDNSGAPEGPPSVS
jgi:hypothetical protein